MIRKVAHNVDHTVVKGDLVDVVKGVLSQSGLLPMSMATLVKLFHMINSQCHVCGAHISQKTMLFTILKSVFFFHRCFFLFFLKSILHKINLK